MKIGIGNDHSALELKAEIVEFLKEKGHEVVDYGTYTSESCDYPVYGEKVARAVVAGEVEKGILICGTGLGISLAANKVKGIRACVCSEPFTAKMSRAHNDCNVLAFGARVVGEDDRRYMDQYRIRRRPSSAQSRSADGDRGEKLKDFTKETSALHFIRA